MNKYAVIGLGRFGSAVAAKLYEKGIEVVGIDSDEKILEESKGKLSFTLRIDCTDETELKKSGIQEFDAVILAIGKIETSVLTSAILKKIGVNYIHAKVNSLIHAKILEVIGVQNILFPEKQVGEQLAQSLLFSNVLNYMELSTGHAISEIVVPEKFVGKALQQLNLPTEKNVFIIAIKYDTLSVSEDGKNIIESVINNMPGANDILKEGDILVLLGPKENIQGFINEDN